MEIAFTDDVRAVQYEGIGTGTFVVEVRDDDIEAVIPVLKAIQSEIAVKFMD